MYTSRCMATHMIRKQVYLARAQERKLKTLAAARGCTEAAVIRDALDQLPAPSGSVADRLVVAGLLAGGPDHAGGSHQATLEALEAELEAWVAKHPEPLSLVAAVEADRSER
jgi:predicted transcriptional regulator